MDETLLTAPDALSVCTLSFSSLRLAKERSEIAGQAHVIDLILS